MYKDIKSKNTWQLAKKTCVKKQMGSCCFENQSNRLHNATFFVVALNVLKCIINN